jgi:hypothetical protein
MGIAISGNLACQLQVTLASCLVYFLLASWPASPCAHAAVGIGCNLTHFGCASLHHTGFSNADEHALHLPPPLSPPHTLKHRRCGFCCCVLCTGRGGKVHTGAMQHGLPHVRQLPTIAFHAASQGQQRSPKAAFTALITVSGSGRAFATGGNALLTRSAANTGQNLQAHHCRIGFPCVFCFEGQGKKTKN